MAVKDDWANGDSFGADDANAVASAVNANESALAGKADAVHSHNAADVTGGQFNIARIPTGTSAATVCVGNDARLSNTRTPTDNTVSTAKIQNGAVTEVKLHADVLANRPEVVWLADEDAYDALTPTPGVLYLWPED